jgi:prevent-host-death family protein
MKLARDIMSLSTFKRDSNKVMRQMKKTKQPVVLTINGKAAVVVQDAEGYQGLLDLKERSETIAVLRQRLASLDSKKGRTADEFFNEFFAANKIPTEDWWKSTPLSSIRTLKQTLVHPINGVAESGATNKQKPGLRNCNAPLSYAWLHYPWVARLHLKAMTSVSKSGN